MQHAVRQRGSLKINTGSEIGCRSEFEKIHRKCLKLAYAQVFHGKLKLEICAISLSFCHETIIRDKLDKNTSARKVCNQRLYATILEGPRPINGLASTEDGDKFAS